RPAAHHLCAMAACTKGGEQNTALFDLGPGSRQLESRHRNRWNHALVMRERCRPSKRERQKFSWSNLSFAGGPIAEHLGSAPSGEYRDVLGTVHLVRHRWRHDPDFRVETPKQFAIGR